MSEAELQLAAARERFEAASRSLTLARARARLAPGDGFAERALDLAETRYERAAAAVINQSGGAKS